MKKNKEKYKAIGAPRRRSLATVAIHLSDDLMMLRTTRVSIQKELYLSHASLNHFISFISYSLIQLGTTQL